VTELTEHLRQLRFREMFRNAAVVTESESECVFRAPFPMHVEDVRIGEDLLISVGGLVRRDDALAGFDNLEAPMSAGFANSGMLGSVGAETGSISAFIGDKMLGKAKMTFPPILTSSLATRFIAMAEPV